MSQPCYSCGFPVYYNSIYKKFMCEAGCDDDSVRVGQIRSYEIEYLSNYHFATQTTFVINVKSKYDAEVEFFEKYPNCRILKMEELSKVYAYKIYRIHDNMEVGQYRTKKIENQEDILIRWIRWTGSNYPISQLKAVDVT
jgi:hypothetical protein